jgi:hypothetical protein
MNPPDILKKNPAYQAGENQILAMRPVRGGCWLVGDADTARSDFRMPIPSIARMNFIGFRCVLARGGAAEHETGSPPVAAPSVSSAANALPLGIPIDNRQTGSVAATAPTPGTGVEAPRSTPPLKPAFVGTWRGKVTTAIENDRYEANGLLVVSADERAVTYGDRAPVHCVAVREGDTLSWSFNSETAAGQATSRCVLKLTGKNEASFSEDALLHGVAVHYSGHLTRRK